MERNRKTSGISLVALVVTIIVLIILTGAVIVTFMEGGIIDRTKESVFKNDMRTYQEMLITLNAANTIDKATGNGEGVEDKLPDIKEEYNGIVTVVDGKLVLAEGYENVASEDQQEWLDELGIKEPAEEVVVVESSPAEWFTFDASTGTITGFSDAYDMTITDIVIPAEIDGVAVTDIGDNAFVFANITSVVIPEGVLSIGKSSFSQCFYLASVIIPEGVTSIGMDAFDSSAISNITIPKSVTSIGQMAFYCSDLTNVIILGRITTIEKNTFAGCHSLTSITISDSVTNIETGAFDECENLTTVNYTGSVDDWSVIEIGEFNEALTSATIIYTN